MTKKIPIQSWMVDANSITLIKALTKKGASARFVGGCVRDAVLGRPINDIDIATDALPNTVIELLETAGLKAMPTGLKHGTITGVVNHQPFEITTLRRDVENFGRHATVAFSTNWEEDARRRDFTMNAMSLELDGRLHDYFGGLDDATNGLVRFVGNATSRIEEDHLRLLRYFRFHAYYAKGAPDQHCLSACKALSNKIKDLSGERIRQEVLKLFKAPNPIYALEIMFEAGIFKHLFTSPVIDFIQDDMKALQRYLNIEIKHHMPVDSLCRMAVLLKNQLDEKQASNLADRLVLSKQDKSDWLSYVLRYIDSNSQPHSISNYQMLDQCGSVNFKKILAISAASDNAILTDNWWDFIKHKANIPFPLHGRDVMELGIPAGPAIGQLLKQTRLWWLAAGFTPNKAECLNHLSNIIEKNA